MNAKLGKLALAIAISAAVAAPATAGHSRNGAAPASVSYGQVITLPIAESVPVANATSVMLRNRHGVTFSFRTTGLEPDTAYTLWVLVFNNPEFCIGSDTVKCAPPAGDSAPDTPIEASLVWGAGGISDGWGQLRLEGKLLEGEGGWSGFKAFGPGLNNSFKAEIHLALRRHGSAEELHDLGLLEEALTTPGACVGSPCGADKDVQGVVHAAR